MLANRYQLLDVILMLTPEDATDKDALKLASEHAVDEIERQLPVIRERFSSVMARFVASEAKRIRNDWLKAHGAYRNG